MGEIDRMVALALSHLEEENRLRAFPDEKSLAAQREITSITGNVRLALNLQRDLLIKCNQLKKLYLLQVQDSLFFRKSRRYDFEAQVLRRMEQFSFSETTAISKLRGGLLAPLFLPDVSRQLNLSLFYSRQAKIKEAARDGLIEEEESQADVSRQARVKLRNDAHIRVVRLMLELCVELPEGYYFHDYWQRAKSRGDIQEMLSERLLFLDMLKLYEIREIDLARWIGEHVAIMDSVGEFDLNYCLLRCYEQDRSLFGTNKIYVGKSGEMFETRIDGFGQVTMDDLFFAAGRRLMPAHDDGMTTG
jgi:hypothetical protein